MSLFFEALEQAERERAERGGPAADGVASTVETWRPPVPIPAAEQAPPAEAKAAPATDREAVVRERRPSPLLASPPPAPAAAHPEPLTLPLTEGVDEHLVSLLRPSSFEAEHYRTLRHVVEQARRETALAVLGVSSPTAGDGKTLTAINLAGALAQAPGTNVLLIELDLRKPAVARHLGLDEVDDDVTRALLNPQLTLDQVVRPCPPFNLSVLASRRAVNTTYELLKSPRCGELIAAARERYDYVVLDLPPMVPLPDCRVVEKWLDGFVVVVAAHKTPRRVVAEALATVDPAKVTALVFNGDDGALASYSYGLPDNRHERGWRGLIKRGQRLGRGNKGATKRSSFEM